MHRTFEFPNKVEFPFHLWVVLHFRPPHPTNRTPRSRTLLNYPVHKNQLSASFPALTLHVVWPPYLIKSRPLLAPLQFPPSNPMFFQSFSRLYCLFSKFLLPQSFSRLSCLSSRFVCYTSLFQDSVVRPFLFAVVPVFFKTFHLLFQSFLRLSICCSSLS